MGWAIGFAPVHGDGILVADTRVIFSQMEKLPAVDCLQKIHYVGPNILSAFTGSVKIGFRVVGELKKQLGSARIDQGWNIDEISKIWIPKLLRHIYENAEESEKALGLEIAIVAAHPHKSHGGSTTPWIDAIGFRCPDFESEKSFLNQPLLIGNQTSKSNRIAELCRKQFSIQTASDSPESQMVATIAQQDYDLGAFQIGLINRGKAKIASSGEITAIQSYGNFAKYCAERKLEPFSAMA
jgi:hypothetical protein